MALVAGVLVDLGARWFAASSCSGYDPPGTASSCGALVASLAWRVGLAAAASTLVMSLLATALQRTQEAIERDRRLREEEAAGAAD
jgi:hypothetical protein